MDDAVRRRFVKRLYIALPEADARVEIIRRMLFDQKHDIDAEQTLKIANDAEGWYSVCT